MTAQPDSNATTPPDLGIRDGTVRTLCGRSRLVLDAPSWWARAATPQVNTARQVLSGTRTASVRVMGLTVGRGFPNLDFLDGRQAMP